MYNNFFQNVKFMKNIINIQEMMLGVQYSPFIDILRVYIHSEYFNLSFVLC